MMLSGVKQCLTKKSFSDAGNANWRHERKKKTIFRSATANV